MGICGSSNNGGQPVDKQATKNTAEIDEKLRKAADEDKAVIKLLLLGAGESGKSTLFKQMITIYGKGFSEAERMQYLPVIHNNIITSMQTLVRRAVAPLNPNNIPLKNTIDELKGDEEINPALADCIAALWADPAVVSTYEQRAALQVPDSCNYFFNKVKEIGVNGYSPSQEDMLRSRARTTGIVESEFVIDKNRFKMFDVGGQRNERKKWLNCFENVTAVLFVAALSEYDQYLYEDETTNRMDEALRLFEETVNLRWFDKTAIILFLNKKDLFDDKIKKVPISTFFKEYNGDNSFESSANYIKDQFCARTKNPDKSVYGHFTCATDKNQVQQIFESVRDIIIRQSLRDLAL